VREDNQPRYLLYIVEYYWLRRLTFARLASSYLHCGEYMTPARAPETSLGEFEQLVLLALLRLRDNAYGATIHQEVQKRTRRQISISAVYTTLDRLEEKGLVQSRTGEPTPRRGGRRKKYFTLEPVGAEALAQSYRVFREMTRGLERQLAKH